jgi:prophage antirepressor-like protein
MTFTVLLVAKQRHNLHRCTLVKPRVRRYRDLGPDHFQLFKGGLSTPLPNRGQLFTSEAGLYKMVMRSDKKEAMAFQNWVTSVVLPTLRKTGVNVVGEEKLKEAAADPQVAAETLEQMTMKVTAFLGAKVASMEELLI